MFTGIVEEIGEIAAIKRGAASAQVKILCNQVLSDLEIGDSVAVNGVCLTATTIGKSYFEADVMHETLRASSLSNLTSGSKVNLERAMKAGGRFGGHIVSGHIDGTSEILSITPDDNAKIYRLKASPDMLKYIVHKGSVTLDGTSLTVSKVGPTYFEVSLIPHTLSSTILQYKKPGDLINVETDILGRYVEKLLFNSTNSDFPAKSDSQSGITEAFLMENGF